MNAHSKTLAITASAVILAGVAFAAGRGAAPASPAPGQPVRPVPGAAAPHRGGDQQAGTDQPTDRVRLRLVNGVPVGYPHTKQGALSAAANYAAAFGSPAVLTASGRDGLLRTVAVPDADRQVRERLAKAPKSAMLAGLAQDRRNKVPFVLRTVPLTVRLRGMYGPDAVRVNVYAATYVAGSQNTATIGHGDAELALAWRNGDWKLTQITNHPQVGPVPAGYVAPENGWQPGTGENLVDVSQHVRDAMSGGAVPAYVVP